MSRSKQQIFAGKSARVAGYSRDMEHRQAGMPPDESRRAWAGGHGGQIPGWRRPTGAGAVDMGVATEMHEACPHRAVVWGVGHLGSVAVYVCMWLCVPTNPCPRASPTGSCMVPFFSGLGQPVLALWGTGRGDCFLSQGRGKLVLAPWGVGACPVLARTATGSTVRQGYVRV